MSFVSIADVGTGKTMDFLSSVANIFDGDCTLAIGARHKDALREDRFVLSEYLAEIGMWLDEKLSDHPFEPHHSANDAPVEGRLGPRRTIFDVADDRSILISKDKLTLQSPNAFSTVKANCCVYSGRWMYEVQLRSKGVMQIGWCSAHCKFTQDTGVGDTRYSYGLDGSKQRIWHVYTKKYGPFWRSGDIFGVCVDMDAGQIEYYRNGAPLGEAFNDIERGPGLALFPAVSLAYTDSLTANFGGSPFKHPVDRYRPLQEPPEIELYKADCLLKYLVNLSGTISQHSRRTNREAERCTTDPNVVTPDSIYMLLAAALIERIAPLLGNSYVVEDKVFGYIRRLCVLRSNAGGRNEAPTQPGAPESTLGTFLTLLWTYLEPEEMKLFLKRLLNFLANTYKETPVDLEYEKQRKTIVILTCVCNHPATRKYLLECKFFKKNCLPLFLYTKPPDESTLEQLLPDDHIWTAGLGGSRETYLAACEKLKAHTSVLYTLQKNLIHVLMNNRDGDEISSPSSRRLFVAKVRKFVMDNNVELRLGLYSSTTQPAIGLSFLCTLLDVAKTVWEEECGDHHTPGASRGKKPSAPSIDCRLFYDGSFKYANLDRIGGVLSYLRKHFREQLLERLGSDHPSLVDVDQASDLRSEIAAFNVFLDSAMFLVSGGPTTAYSLVSRAANSVPDRQHQPPQQQQQPAQSNPEEGASSTTGSSGGRAGTAIGCGPLDPYRAVCELLDSCVIFYNAVAHKYVVMIADLRDNITHLSDILLETKTNCDEVMHNLEELKRCSVDGKNSEGYNQQSHEELLSELDARFGQRKSIFAKRSMELARKQAWYRSVALGSHRRSLLCWLLGIIFDTLHRFSEDEVLFAFLPETYVNVTPFLLDTVLDFSFHDTALQHDLTADRSLIQTAANVLARHLGDGRVVQASCKDALIQALGSLTCHEAGIRALECATAENQLALVRALLRPYENRAWGQSNWLFLRFWLGHGFAYRESRPPCVWQAGKDPAARRSLGLYRSRSKSGPHTGLLHLVAPACPSEHFQHLISDTLSRDEPFCTTFLNSVLSQLNWAFSEFIHILQDIQNISQREEQLAVEAKQLKICSMCFELTVSLMRALEMIVTITPSLFQDTSRANGEIILGRICQLAIQVLSRVTVPPGCFQHVMDLCLPELSNVTHFAIISATIGMLLALMRHELGGSCMDLKIPRITKYLLTDTSFHIASLEYALGEVKTPISSGRNGEAAPRGNFDPKMRAHIDPLTNEVRVPSPFSTPGPSHEIIPDPPIIKFNMADYSSHVTEDEVRQIVQLIKTLQLRQTLLSEITVLSEDSLCPICYAKSNSAAFEPCHHQSCETCIMQHLMNSKQCFYCKILITRVTRQDGVTIYENCSTPPPPPVRLVTTGITTLVINPEEAESDSTIDEAVDEFDGPSGSVP